MRLRNARAASIRRGPGVTSATPAFNAGSLVCGTHNNAPVLMWTKDDVLLLGQVQGPDLSNLYGWWLSLG